MKCICYTRSLPCIWNVGTQHRAQAKHPAGTQRVARKCLARSGPQDMSQPLQGLAGSILCTCRYCKLTFSPKLHTTSSGLPNRSGLCTTAVISFIPGAGKGAKLPCLWGSHPQGKLRSQLHVPVGFVFGFFNKQTNELPEQSGLWGTQLFRRHHKRVLVQ